MGDRADKVQQRLAITNIRRVVQQLPINVVEECVLVGCVAEYGTLITRQFVAQGAQELVVWKDTKGRIQVFAAVFHTTVSMLDMMRELERDGFLGVPTRVEGQRDHGGFEIDEVLGKRPAGHLCAQPFDVDPRVIVAGRRLLDLQPSTLTRTQARLSIWLWADIALFELIQLDLVPPGKYRLASSPTL